MEWTLARKWAIQLPTAMAKTGMAIRGTRRLLAALWHAWLDVLGPIPVPSTLLLVLAPLSLPAAISAVLVTAYNIIS